MQPGTYDLEIVRGDRATLFGRIALQELVNGEWVLTGEYMDLTGFTLKAQLRESEDSADVAAEFTFTQVDQTNPDTKGSFSAHLLPVETAVLTKATYKWDLQLSTGPEHVTTYLKGAVNVTKDVTK